MASPILGKMSLRPARMLVLGFGIVILTGALLLWLPFATVAGKSLSFIDALFSSTTSVCVTGITVVETGSTFSLFGQIVILILVQVGGLGFMTFQAAIFLVLKRKIALGDRVVLQEALSENGLQRMVGTIKQVLAIAFGAEGVGAVLLSIRFIPMFGLWRGAYYSIWHSVSAFCNAGLDVFGRGDSLVPFANDPYVLIVIMALIILGGLGFAVVSELWQRHDQRRISVHTKLVMLMTVILIVSGAVLYYVTERSNPLTLGDPSWTAGQRIMTSIFQSVTTRTAGFFTIPQRGLTEPSIVLTCALMMIGASPAGTGGGIKTTTFAVALLAILGYIQGKSDINFANRRISRETILKAFAVIISGIMLIFLAWFALTLIEAPQLNSGALGAKDMALEVFSAFGTVGLSTGMTGGFHVISRIVLIIMMFIGRVGAFTVASAVGKRLRNTKRILRYPEERIIVG